MATGRARKRRIALPRALADLPFARHLVAAESEPVVRGSYDCTSWVDAVWDDLVAPDVKLLECALRFVNASGGSLRGARLNDVWICACRLVGVTLADTSWAEVEVNSSAFAGLQFHGAELRRVTFTGCKLDSVNFRGTVLVDVDFVDCVISDIDLAGSTLERVRFPGCRLNAVKLAGSRLTKVEFQDAVELAVPDGIDSLRGASINYTQLLDLAPAFADAAGVEVRPDRDG